MKMCCCGCCCGWGRHHWHHGGREDFGAHVHRRFMTRKERIDMLKEYAESLRNELAGVEEELKELKSS